MANKKPSSTPAEKDFGSIAYRELEDYARTTHASNKRLIRTGMIAFYSLPVVLILFMKMTNADRSVILLVWIICMFVLAFFLIFLSYADARLKKRVDKVELSVPDDLSVLPPLPPLSQLPLRRSGNPASPAAEDNTPAADVAPVSGTAPSVPAPAPSVSPEVDDF